MTNKSRHKGIHTETVRNTNRNQNDKKILNKPASAITNHENSLLKTAKTTLAQYFQVTINTLKARVNKNPVKFVSDTHHNFNCNHNPSTPLKAAKFLN